MICYLEYKKYSGNKKLITGVKTATWYMFYLYDPESQVVITFPRTIIYNSCDQIIVTDDIFDDGGHLDEQDDFGFSSS